MPDQAEERMKAAFNLFDKDGDGKISQHELGEVLKTLGKASNEVELREMIGGSVSGLFTERGGCIDYTTFKQLISGEMKTETSQITDLQDAFKLLDAKSKGYIDSNTLRLICAKLGEDLSVEECDEMVREALIGYDGQIFYDGLLKILITQ